MGGWKGNMVYLYTTKGKIYNLYTRAWKRLFGEHEFLCLFVTLLSIYCRHILIMWCISKWYFAWFTLQKCLLITFCWYRRCVTHGEELMSLSSKIQTFGKDVRCYFVLELFERYDKISKLMIAHLYFYINK